MDVLQSRASERVSCDTGTAGSPLRRQAFLGDCKYRGAATSEAKAGPQFALKSGGSSSAWYRAIKPNGLRRDGVLPIPHPSGSDSGADPPNDRHAL